MNICQGCVDGVQGTFKALSSLDSSNYVVDGGERRRSRSRGDDTLSSVSTNSVASYPATEVASVGAKGSHLSDHEGVNKTPRDTKSAGTRIRKRGVSKSSYKVNK